jgi:two-component system phosphate regulon sensor histidine kinase PhoR
MCLLALVAVILTATLSAVVFYGQITRDMNREMHNGIGYIKAGLDEEGRLFFDRIKNVNPDTRITLIDQDGTVLFDNKIDPVNMENHANRPEVAGAFKNGQGEDIRFSATMEKRTHYIAQRLPDGTVLRLSSTTDTVLSALKQNIPMIVLAILLVILLAFLLARRQVRKIVDPINSINLEEPTENDVYEELAPLLMRVHHQRRRIDNQISELNQRQEEFDAITANMEEGLIVLDERGFVLYVNHSALKLVDAEWTDPAGKHISSLNRDLKFQMMVDDALDGEFSEEMFVFEQRRYQLRANPVFQGDKKQGAVLLMLDVTEKEKAESVRREFSANVSHELKTPLTAISGFAELLKNDMVRKSDIPAVADRVYEEACRMADLIDDIIQISRLDERSELPPKETADIYQIALEVVERLTGKAEHEGVRLNVEGQPTKAEVMPRLIEELIFNLCENSIKYNKPGGEVNIRIFEQDGRATIEVADTGIGIPSEHCERIFERFYRVDKSHSRETGGTGLGLAIVKHIVASHHGDIRLDSTPGVGTTITVELP